jgi:N-acetylmuramoyl-L-alanine amidase
MRKIKYIILHCTASPQTQTIEAIQNYWRTSLGWKSPGYHFIIKPDGEAVELLSIEKPSNGVKGFNSNSINISYIGGVEVSKSINSAGKIINVLGKAVDNRTPEQIQTMIDLIKKFKAMFPTAEVKGHRDFSPDKNRDGIIQPSEWMKTCPSFSVAEWLKSIGLN